MMFTDKRGLMGMDNLTAYLVIFQVVIVLGTVGYVLVSKPEAPASAAAASGGTMPGGMPGGMPGAMPGGMPGGMPGAMPGGAPGLKTQP